MIQKRFFREIFVCLACVLLCAANALTASIHYVQQESSLSDDPKELYIDLMKRAVANTIYEDPAYAMPNPNQLTRFNSMTRELGKDHPLYAHTMIGMKRLNNIQACLVDILNNNVQGDCIETGVWRGGATILMRAILKAYGDTTRKVWVADSFAGLPPPDVAHYPQDRGIFLCDVPYLSVSMETVQDNFKKYGLLDKQVVFLKGFFKDTLLTAPVEKISLLRLDGDLYQSTIEALTALYPKVSIGGYIIIDDAQIPACMSAVTDYRKMYGIEDPAFWIDQDGLYWQKTK